MSDAAIETCIGYEPTDKEWDNKSVCRKEKLDPEVFEYDIRHKDKKEGRKLTPKEVEEGLQKYCGRCVVRTECLATGLSFKENLNTAYGGLTYTTIKGLKSQIIDEVGKDQWKKMSLEQKAEQILVLSEPNPTVLDVDSASASASNDLAPQSTDL